eukprot:2753293-Alexandrium_andersonii.AAC.1
MDPSLYLMIPTLYLTSPHQRVYLGTGQHVSRYQNTHVPDKEPAAAICTVYSVSRAVVKRGMPDSRNPCILGAPAPELGCVRPQQLDPAATGPASTASQQQSITLQ